VWFEDEKIVRACQDSWGSRDGYNWDFCRKPC
jgi:hypothetical protein